MQQIQIMIKSAIEDKTVGEPFICLRKVSSSVCVIVSSFSACTPPSLTVSVSFLHLALILLTFSDLSAGITTLFFPLVSLSN